MTVTGLQQYGQVDLDALDGKGCPTWTISLTDSLDLSTRNQVDSLKAAYESRFRTCRVHLGVLMPFSAEKIMGGGWCRVRTARLTDRNGDNVYEANFFVTEGRMACLDPDHEEPIQGRSGIQVQLRVKKI